MSDNLLIDVLESIMECEYTESILKDTEEVIRYSKWVEDIDLTVYDARRILMAGKHWLHELSNCSDSARVNALKQLED